MPFACKWCIATKGLRGSEISSLPQTEEELYAHIEREHHVPVQREGETGEQCMERFKRENPDAGGANCKCPTCAILRRALDDLMVGPPGIEPGTGSL